MNLPDPRLEIATLVPLFVKMSLVLVAAAATDALLRRRASAAIRHLLWTLALASMLLLPLASALVPAWNVAVPITPTKMYADELASPPDPAVPAIVDSVSAPVASTRPAQPVAPAAPRDASVRWATVLVVTYAAGVLLLLGRLTVEQLIVRRFARQAVDASDPEWLRLFRECERTAGVSAPVRLLRSRSAGMPMAFGTWRPAILLPSIADTWSADRRRAVLLHELAHVSRRDCLTQTMAGVVCAMYWVHPGVWWAARRLRVERELACDDRVLAAGTQAREYAGHLLEIAYALGGHRSPALAVSMARRQQLEGRMLAVLDGARNRAMPRLRGRAAGVALASAVLLPLASVQAVGIGPVSAQPEATWSSTHGLRDPAARPRAISRPAAFAVDAHAVMADTGQAPADTDGSWEIRPSDIEGTIHLRLTRGDSTSGFSIAVAKLDGLTPAQLSGAGGPVRFTLRRDAGTFSFDGVVRNGVGGGTYTFAASPTFAAELVKRGIERPTAADQYRLARGDIGFAYLDELAAQHYARPDLAQLVRAGDHGAGLDYLRRMGAAGYHVGSLEPLITLRDHGVTPDYISGLADAGYKGLAVDALLRLRDHGITPEYIHQLAEAGYKGLSTDELLRARDHGVTADYLRGLHDAGYGTLTLDQAIGARDHGVTGEFVKGLGDLARGQSLEAITRLRDHGITPEYVRALHDLGYDGTPEALTGARDHGITAEYVQGLTALGYRNLALDALIRLRDHGVTAEYARQIKALGYDNVDPDTLVRLRDHGLTADRIRRANDRAGTRLPLDLLEKLNGM